MTPYVGFIESAFGCEGWVSLGPGSDHITIDWDCPGHGHGRRRETEVISTTELRHRMPYAEALHRRIRAAEAGVDPSGC
jgi:hypothetical protein